MIVEQPATDLEAARRNRERIEKIRKKEGKHYTFKELEEIVPASHRPYRRGIRGLRG